MDYLTHTRLSFFLLLIAISLGKLQAATPHASDKPSQASPAGGPITFRSPLAKAFVVPQSLPGVGFPIQQSYAGRLNIATDPKQTAEAFFWMIPADNARGTQTPKNFTTFFVYSHQDHDVTGGRKTCEEPIPSQASPAGGPITFRSPLAKAFVVPQSLPGVGFPIQQSYAGRLNIATDPKQTAEAFFWMIPADNARGSKHVTMWINGYDVCSSLYGAFRGSGPITMSLEGGKPVKNPYSWTRSTNVIYLDVLPKVGFTRGTYSVNSSRDVGVLVFSFLKSFLKVFPEMNGLNLFLAGNYYTGTYANYAAQKIYAQQSQLGLKLQGMILVDALIAASDFQMYAATTKFVTENNDVFKFDAAKLQKLQATDKQCGFSEYFKKYLTYPPSGHFPEIVKALDPSNPPYFTPDCMNLYSQVKTKTRSYPIGEHTLMLLSFHLDVHGSPTRFEPMVFPNDDGSGLATDILPDVIQRSKKVVIMHAELDATLPVEGMRLALQNVTWAGKQGFQKPLTTNLIVAGKQSGKYQSERGLTFVQVAKSGAMIAHDQGEVALTVLDYLLGNRPAL
ncbi:hypothetical protein PSTG_17349 [Puccinia striiformis f. sp. tritici PST-78]|uniref:Uncharacterized protein n=1 Tax=Puccinia striiformis f. sp. tritici PST-78 TaxID=1165861 RepID=A0A0L0UQ83_9BASI|nr:hypothetical protein PSTG_17349 [Puccinia striiformis f. sp. tritici PST-78]